MTQPAMWWIPDAVPEQSDERCPCGARLKRPAEYAHGVCDGCRIDAHRKPRKREPIPDFVDVELPLDWGQP